MAALTPGTEGYRTAIDRFVEATLSLEFDELHAPFLALLPASGSHILDVGAGIGRDAFALCARGYSVVAVEPDGALRATGERLHHGADLRWVNDALPDLPSLSTGHEPFDFVLASAVWHHLNRTEQLRAVPRIADLMHPGGVFAVSLRHGPAGVGTCVFPTDASDTIRWAGDCGLTEILRLDHQPSLLPGKPDVTWSRLAFRKGPR